jgi:hypothetical protein
MLGTATLGLFGFIHGGTRMTNGSPAGIVRVSARGRVVANLLATAYLPCASSRRAAIRLKANITPAAKRTQADSRTVLTRYDV